MNEMLGEDRIVILAASGDRASVLDAAARLLATGAPLDHRLINASLSNRERLASTAIGHGVAIPHGRIAGIGETRGAFLRLDQPADFGALDGIAVDLVLAMAVPEDSIQQHLLQLAEVAERFASPEFRQRLRRARDVGQLVHWLMNDDQRRNAA